MGKSYQTISDSPAVEEVNEVANDPSLAPDTKLVTWLECAAMRKRFKDKDRPSHRSIADDFERNPDTAAAHIHGRDKCSHDDYPEGPALEKDEVTVKVPLIAFGTKKLTIEVDDKENHEEIRYEAIREANNLARIRDLSEVQIATESPVELETDDAHVEITSNGRSYEK